MQVKLLLFGAVPPLHGNHIAPLHIAPAPDHRRVHDTYMYNIDPKYNPPT